MTSDCNQDAARAHGSSLQRLVSRRLRCADLFCGAGGAAVGLHRAGFDVEGWDIKPQKNFPYVFHLGDALDADLSGFDFVWASPPCQEHTALRARVGKHYECFIERTRAKLEAWGGPYILENVVGAPLRVDVMLCAVMFGLRAYRHRIFESNVPLKPHPLPHPKHPVAVNRRKKNRREHWDAGGFVTVVGDIGRYVGPEAMGIDWMTGNELSQAIPPAYSEFLTRPIVARLKAANDQAQAQPPDHD